MRAVLQRVKEASVDVDGVTVGAINEGLLVYVGICNTDTAEQADLLSKKIVSLRVFSDEKGRMNHSLEDISAEVLVVSQFTLYANCEKGRRPSFINAGDPLHAKKLYDLLIEKLREKLEKRVATGKFGAMMEVSSLNYGPATFLLDL